MLKSTLAFALCATACGGFITPGESSMVASVGGASSDPSMPLPTQGPVSPTGSVPSAAVTLEDIPSDAGADQQTTLTWCEPHPTTTISVVANLDANAVVPSNAWITPTSSMPYMPVSASNFSTSAYVFDSAGRIGTLDIYFRNADAFLWQYHAVLSKDEVAVIEVASGQLEFAGDGALEHRETWQPLRLPGTDGTWGPEITLNLGTPKDEGGTGTNGIVEHADACNVSMQAINGNYASLGATCPDSTQDSVTPNPADASAGTPIAIPVPFCDWKATSRLTIVANLNTHATLHTDWDSSYPAQRSNLAARITANDRQGRVATLGLYFQRVGDGLWKYHVLLQADAQVLEIANGELEFNQDGSLREVRALRALVLPSVDGQPNRPIDLDFGLPTASGGNGIDGVTSFSTNSHIAELTTDATVGTIAANCPPTPNRLPFITASSTSPSCTAQMTTYVLVGGNLSPDEPIVTQPWPDDNAAAVASFSASASIVDSFGMPVDLTVYYMHRSELTWEYHATTATSESLIDLGSGTIQFSASGLLRQLDVLSPFRMLQSDGSRGPWVNIDFGDTSDSPWLSHQFTSFACSSNPWLQTDGHVASSGDCID